MVIGEGGERERKEEKKGKTGKRGREKGVNKEKCLCFLGLLLGLLSLYCNP